MKSRKKVSRKKTARHKTSTRRNSKRTHSGRRRFTRIKRGGTIPVPVIQRLRTFMVHKMRPLIYQARPNIYFRHDPQPADGSITNVNDRFYKTFADIEFEDGDIKDSIRNFIEEVKNPVKTADKMKSIKEKYDAIMKKLEEEKKRQLDKQEQKLMVVGKQFTSSPRPVLSAIDVGSSSTPTPSSNVSPRSRAISDLVKRPFTTPTRSDYSTNKTQPDILPSKPDIRPPGQPLGEVTPLRNPFNVNGPITSPLFSPPPPHQSANEENENPQLLLSPGPEVIKLRF